MSQWARDQQPSASNRTTGDQRPFPNLWKRVIHAEPKVSSGASMWALYMVGALMILVSVFTLLGAVLWIAGEIGTGWQGRVAGGFGVLVAFAMFWVGRWMTGAMEPRS